MTGDRWKGREVTAQPGRKGDEGRPQMGASESYDMRAQTRPDREPSGLIPQSQKAPCACLQCLRGEAPVHGALALGTVY